jgi:hypothetical protein
VGEVTPPGPLVKADYDMREDVIARQVGAMKEARLDAIVSCSPAS